MDHLQNISIYIRINDWNIKNFEMNMEFACSDHSLSSTFSSFFIWI